MMSVLLPVCSAFLPLPGLHRSGGAVRAVTTDAVLFVQVVRQA